MAEREPAYHDVRSATRHSLQLFGVPRSLQGDLRAGAIDLPEIVWGELDVDSAEVLLKAAELRGTWDWNNPRLLGKQPSECYLSRCRLLPFSDLP